MKMRDNIVADTDSYKYTHYWQYPEGTENVWSYFEARTGAKFNKTLWYGLQYYLIEFLEGVVVTRDLIDEAEDLALNHFGTLDGTFNRPMWEYIVDKYGGKLPIRICAVPEGSLIPVSNILMSIVNTDKKCFPLTNHVETLLSKLWYPNTVATLSYELLRLITDYTNWTSSSDALRKFSIHDFGYRGVSSEESAAIGGSAHLVNFMGTDTTKAMRFAKYYYGASYKNLAFSVKATEHSVMTPLGPRGERAIVRRLLEQSPTGIMAMVIDSFNYRNFVEMIGTEFKDAIVNRNGKIVIRPDSGDPVAVSLDVIKGLAKNFGFTINSKGYKELPPYIGMLWGDGIDYDGVRNILFAFKNDGWATSNIIFGMGGALLQKVNRDTQRFAFKCSAQCRDGVWYDVFKEPLDSSKVSKRGILKLGRNGDGMYFTVKDTAPDFTDHLECRFENGDISSRISFDEVRANAEG